MRWRKRPQSAEGKKDALGDSGMLSLQYDPEHEEAGQRAQFIATLRRLAAPILQEWRLIIPGVLLIGTGTFATVLEPRLLGWIVDLGVLARDVSKLQQLVGLFLAIEGLRVASLIFQAYCFDRLGQRVMQRLRVELLAHLQRLPAAVYDRVPTGRLVTRVTNDVSAMAEMFSAGFVTILGNFLTITGILISLFVLDWRLGLISGGIFPLLAWAARHFSLRLRDAYRSARQKLSGLNAFIAENILGMKIVQLFNREPLHLKRFEQINARYAEAQAGSVKVFALFQPSITLAAGISAALVIYHGGERVAAGLLPVGVLVSYFGYVQALYQPMRELAEKWNLFLSGMTAAERIFSVMDWELEEPGSALLPPVRPRGIRGDIAFEGVWFAYKNEEWVLRDLSFQVRAGEKIGLVGHTGAGKSTITSLLLRFYEPQKGRITIDGTDIRSIPRRELRSIFGIVQQDAFLFSGSIEENISLWRSFEGDEREKLDKVLTALDRPHWLRHGGLMLDERGGNLSMGERQILSFARALSQNPSIWILDEATANIDSATEGKIGALLAHAYEGHTALVVAHRLATVRDADQILVLNRGVLVEQGPHAELVSKDGLYSRLYRYQEVAGV